MRWTHVTAIDAPVDVVWRLTVDLGGLAAYLPTVRRAERLDDGPVRVGSAARLTRPGGLSTVWTVTELEPQRRFVRQARVLGLTMIATHLVDGDRPEGGCFNTLVLQLDEPRPGMAVPLLGPVVRSSLRRENAGLKAAAERAARA